MARLSSPTAGTYLITTTIHNLTGQTAVHKWGPGESRRTVVWVLGGVLLVTDLSLAIGLCGNGLVKKRLRHDVSSLSMV
jgi:hypothetical protein